MSAVQLGEPGRPTCSPCALSPQDESVTQLGQELAQKLGLRVRKAYKRPQVGGLWVPGVVGVAMGKSEEGV